MTDIIDVGTAPNDGTGDPARTAFQAVNANLKKNNFAAAVDPVAGDDNLDGYEIGSRWFNTTLDKVFDCVDASTGAAVWVLLIASGRKTEMFFPEAGLQKQSSGVPAITFQILGNAYVLVYSMRDAQNDSCGAKWVPPVNWNGGTVRVRFWWTPSGSTNIGTVRWTCNSTNATNLEALPSVAFRAIVSDAGSGVVDSIQISPWTAALTLGTAAVGDYVHFDFYRSGSDGSDTFTAIAYLLGVELEYYTDQPTEI